MSTLSDTPEQNLGVANRSLSPACEDNLGWVYPFPPESGIITLPPVYSQADVTPLVVGKAYVDVVFGISQVDADWVLVECNVTNTVDGTPLNIWPGIITNRTVNGFRVQLNGLPDSGNYYLHWAVSGVNITLVPAVSYLLTGPSSGVIGAASTNFTVALPVGTMVTGTVTVTPASTGGGTFTPTTVGLTTSTPSATFIFTPATAGVKTISTTNDGGLTNPVSLTYTAFSSTYILIAPVSGVVDTDSDDFTVKLPDDGIVSGSVTIILSDGGAGGIFTPASVDLTTAAPLATFKYKPVTVGTKTISLTNDGGLVDPDPSNYDVTAAVIVATYYTLTGPSSGAVGVASTNFTVTLMLPGSVITGTATITPSDGGAGGTFTPTTVGLTTASPSATFTYTAASTGTKTISCTNDHSLIDPSNLSYGILATGYSLTGPGSGTAGTPSTNFTATLTPAGGTVSGTVTITPSDGGGGGTFTPTTVGLTTAGPSATFTYTAASAGTKTISATNSGGLTNPGSLSYVAAAAAFDPATIAGLKGWWKADSLALSDGTATDWPDSSSSGYTLVGQPLTANRPVYKTSIVNGKPVIRFNGTNGGLISPSIAVSQPDTWFFVGNETSKPSQWVMLWNAGVGQTIYMDTSGFIQINAGIPLNGVVDRSGAFHVWTIIFNGTSTFVYLDGTLVLGPVNAGALPVGQCTMGTQGGTFYPGDMAEVLLYDSALGTTDRGNVETYLKTKYGL